MTEGTEKNSVLENKIVLRSVYGKVGQKYYIQPCRNKVTKRFSDGVRQVDKYGDLILSDADRNSNRYFISVEECVEVEDGTVFDLNQEYDRVRWEAIKDSFMIADDRYAKDEKGNYLIDGDTDDRSTSPRYGAAELYVYRPGLAAKGRVNRKKLVVNASTYILEDSFEHQVMMARLLGKHMENVPHSDLEDYLLQIAERDPDKIINLYTGSDTHLRILFCEALDKGVIVMKDGLYLYDGTIPLGGTDDSAITWMKNAKNKNTVDKILLETHPEMELTPKAKKALDKNPK